MTLSPLTVIVYEKIIQVAQYVSTIYKLTDQSLNVPFYIANKDIIIFNGGLDKFNLAADLANNIDANIIIYTSTSLSPDISKVNGEVKTITVEDNKDEEVSDDESVSESDSEQKTGKKRSATSKQVESIIGWFEVSITGARDEEILVGVSKGTTKTMIKIHGPPVKPRAKDLNAIRDYPDLWKRFITKLGGISFFKDMNISQREKWLSKNETETDSYIGEENDDTWIELIQPGDGLLVDENVDSADLERLMEGNPDHPHRWWKQEDIIGIIPAKPGSKARRHTLFFNKTFWRIASDFREVKSFNGVVFDVFKGTVSSEANIGSNQNILLVDDITSKVIKAKGTKNSKTTAGNKKTGLRWERSETQTVGFLI